MRKWEQHDPKRNGKMISPVHDEMEVNRIKIIFSRHFQGAPKVTAANHFRSRPNSLRISSTLVTKLFKQNPT